MSRHKDWPWPARVPPGIPRIEGKDKIGEYIRQAIKINPKYEVHGTSFYVIDGKIIDRKDLTVARLRGKDAISIHSHLPSNWREALERGILRMPTDTFSAGDVDVLRKALKEGWEHTMVILTSPDTIDILQIDPKTTTEQLHAFRGIGLKTIEREMSYRRGPMSPEDIREALVRFSDKYGLIYQQNVKIPSIDPGITPRLVPQPTAKEPWQMTIREYLFSLTGQDLGSGPVTIRFGFPTARALQDAIETHGQLVNAAVKEGKPVPSEVLKDYPDLVAHSNQQASNLPRVVGANLYRVFRVRDGQLMFAGSREDATRKLHQLGGTKGGYRLLVTTKGRLKDAMREVRRVDFRLDTIPDPIDFNAWITQWARQYDVPPIPVQVDGLPEGEDGWYDWHNERILVSQRTVQFALTNKAAIPVVKHIIAHEFGHYLTFRRVGVAKTDSCETVIRKLEDASINVEKEANIIAKHHTGLSPSDVMNLMDRLDMSTVLCHFYQTLPQTENKLFSRYQRPLPPEAY